MIYGTLGLPTTEEKTARGASFPAKPALHSPEPLSMTTTVTSSSIVWWSPRLRIIPMIEVLKILNYINKNEKIQI